MGFHNVSFELSKTEGTSLIIRPGESAEAGNSSKAGGRIELAPRAIH